MIDKVIIAARLKEAREKTGMTQAELAADARMAAQTISVYETGKKTPTLDNISLLADALGVSETWLLGLDSPATRKINNLADAYNMIEELEKYFRCTVSIEESEYYPNPYDNYTSMVDYKLIIEDVGETLGSVIEGRNRFYTMDMEQDLKQEMLELWRNKYIAILRQQKTPWEVKEEVIDDGELPF